MKIKKAYIVSQTHWDREWYQDFQHYRYRLVRMMDDLIEHLEKDGSFRTFHLDGQTILIDDYLAIRPEKKDRLEKLIQSGRIIIGPWYVMPDEFLVSGESLLANLRRGYSICAAYGVKPLKNGYVVDIFGHNSQFPQILRGFNIEAATLFRGIADYEKDAFQWRSPDGSEVTVFKLDRQRSYSNFYFAVRWPFEGKARDEKDAVARMKDLLQYMEEAAVCESVLLMDGCDHIDMEPDLPQMLELFRREIPGVEFIHANLEDYELEMGKYRQRLATIEGSLYHIGQKGTNNQLLKNVLSSMVHLKQQNDRCEILLTKYAQPLNAVTQMLQDRLQYRDASTYDAHPRKAYFDQAWTYLLQNQPHDSICGCSITRVHQDNEYRFRQVESICDCMIADALDRITENIALPAVKNDLATLVFNPAQIGCTGISVFELYVKSPHSGNLRFYDKDGAEIAVQILDKLTELRPQHKLRQLISFDTLERLTVACDVAIPPCGYTVMQYQSLDTIGPRAGEYDYAEFHAPKRLTGSLRTGFNRFDNGPLLVEINANGTLTVTDKDTGKKYQDLLGFEDSPDNGDGWNYQTIFRNSRYFSSSNVTISLECDGPLAAVVKLIQAMRVPEKMAENGDYRSSHWIVQEIETLLTILKGQKQIVFQTKLVNQAEAHRLRVIFPTWTKTEAFYTKTPFDMVRWDIKPEDYSQSVEAETFVHPSQGISYIFDAENGLALSTRGLYEIELTDNPEHAMALTLFRAPRHETSTLQPDGVKMKQRLSFDYALTFGKQTIPEVMQTGEKWRMATFSFPFTPRDQGTLPPQFGFYEIDTGNTVVSAIDGDITLASGETATLFRFYDVSGRGDAFHLRLPKMISKAYYIGFNHEILGEVPVSGNSLLLEVGPKKIVTLAVVE